MAFLTLKISKNNFKYLLGLETSDASYFEMDTILNMTCASSRTYTGF